MLERALLILAFHSENGARSDHGVMPSVLIVEDNERFAAMLSDALSNLGVEATLAATAGVAYDLIRSQSLGTYPVILVDNHLGTGMSGIDLMSRLRSEHLLDPLQIANVVWISTDTEVPGLWDFPGYLHNVEHGGNGTTVEELARMAARCMPKESVRTTHLESGAV